MTEVTRAFRSDFDHRRREAAVRRRGAIERQGESNDVYMRQRRREAHLVVAPGTLAIPLHL